MNLSLDLLSICYSFNESLKTDEVEKWSFVVRQIKKSLLPKLKELESIEDGKSFRKKYAEILKDFAKIADLMGVPEVETEIENFARAVNVSKAKKDEKILIKKSITQMVTKLRDEVLSSPPSKSNIFLAMRLVNDYAKLHFQINPSKKLFNKAVHLQTVYDAAIRNLFTRRIKPEF